VSLLSGLAAWLLGGGTLWVVGAVLIGLVVPFTFVAIMPTNKQLLAPGRDLASTETRALLEKWAKLHAVRSVLSLAATLIFIWSLLGALTSRSIRTPRRQHSRAVRSAPVSLVR